MMQRVRIKDIAKKTGISVGTIDRVIHNRGQVAEKTKKIILDALSEVDYKPNLIAQALTAKKKIIISVIIPEGGGDNTFWDLPISGIKKAYEEIKMYNIEMKFYYFSLDDKQNFVSEYKRLIQEKTDAVILVPSFKDESLTFSRLMDKKEIPYVLLNTKLEGCNYLSFVGQNAFQSGLVAGKLLNLCLKEKADVLIVNVHRKDYESAQFSLRTEGFKSYIKQKSQNVNNIIEISIKNEIDIMLKKVFLEHSNIKAIFVSGSKSYQVANFLFVNNHIDKALIGYDLITNNIKFLKNEYINFIISQEPVEQGYKSLMTIFNTLVKKEKCEKSYLMPIHIITKENLV